MPYSRQSYFNPSSRYLKAWALTPQGRQLGISGHKTRSMYDTLSFAIPVFYILFFAAIAFDIYLGFSILAKSGVSIGLITGSVILDIILAIAPFLFATFISSFNHTNTENKIFQSKLECMTKLKGESDKEYSTRKNQIINGKLAEYKKHKILGKIIRYITIAAIWIIAGWKIYTYYSVLPPGFSIWSLANGKIVIIFSFLCAVCHIIGSEKAVAHFAFWSIKGNEFKKHNELHNGEIPIKETLPIDYEGIFKDASHKNTSIKVDKDGNASVEYIHVIWDDEISQLMQRQGDESAKRAVAIVCKENQII
jgi:hypothetical protein